MVPILVGAQVPDVQFGCLENDIVTFVAARALFAGHKAIVVGVPGAFTPVCSSQHVPDFVTNAATLREHGFDLLLCIAPNDPFVLRKWAGDLDPGNKLMFLSDGNLDWTKALGLTSLERDLCLGQRSQRYLMNVDNGIIQRLKVEPGVLDFSCTGVRDAVLLD
jgi:2-Cys peroxiredoxin 5